jgi:hypothetical protein
MEGTFYGDLVNHTVEKNSPKICATVVIFEIPPNRRKLAQSGWSQSYDHELKRQRCQYLQLN